MLDESLRIVLGYGALGAVTLWLIWRDHRANKEAQAERDAFMKLLDEKDARMLALALDFAHATAQGTKAMRRALSSKRSES